MKCSYFIRSLDQTNCGMLFTNFRSLSRSSLLQIYVGIMVLAYTVEKVFAISSAKNEN